MQRMHVGQIGHPIKLKLWDDATNAIHDLASQTATMRFERPDGSIEDVVATIESPTTLGEISYTPQTADFLDQAGVWKVQGIIDANVGVVNFSTSVTSFVVAANLSPP